jgi:fatty-acyl-CoA synthase
VLHKSIENLSVNPILTLGDSLIETATRWPDREALCFPGARVTYESLLDQSIEAARGLRGLGISAGDRVGILKLNTPSYAAFLFGTWLLGGVAVTINARYRSHELSHVIVDSNVRCVVVSEVGSEYVDHAERLENSFDGLLTVNDPHSLDLSNAPNLDAIVHLAPRGRKYAIDRDAFYTLAARVDPLEVSESRTKVRAGGPALVMYTSGTTSMPRGCIQSHESLYRNAVATANRIGLQPTEGFWDPLPLFHTGGLMGLLSCIVSGGRYISASHFDAMQALQMLQEESVDVAYVGFETLIKDILDHPNFESTDLGSLRWILAIGTREFRLWVQERLPQAVQVTGYGSTEMGGVISYNSINDTGEVRANTCGRPFEGVEVSIVSPETGESLGIGMTGEICVRGYSVMLGYVGDGGSSRDVDPCSWFGSGDLGHLTSAGEIVYEGRIKDMLKIGGENVAAAEIEGLLMGHESVRLAQVVGVPEARMEEVAVAFVELVPGAATAEDDLIRYCADRVASFKVPREVHVVDSWPMSATKIQKYKLRDWATEHSTGTAENP